MKTVFIGGSRKIARLNDQIRAKLADIVERKVHVMIGDANGADRAVQAQLAEWSYPNVVVYFVGSRPRNNVGDWTALPVAAPRRRGFEFYAAKDVQMAHDADTGLMLWDGKSRGTLSNVRTLVDKHKPVDVYVSKRGSFLSVRSHADLRDLAGELEVAVPADGEQAELPLGIPYKPIRKKRRRTA